MHFVDESIHMVVDYGESSRRCLVFHAAQICADVYTRQLTKYYNMVL